MKRSIYIVLTLVLLTQSACQKDPLEEVINGNWNNERNILSIKFENQVGNAEIIRIDDVSGAVNLTINSNAAPDLSTLKVEEIVLSYGAKASIKTGDVLNFENTDNSISLLVTSPTGKKREYKVTVTPFTETLIGTYSIDNLILYGGTGPEYGGGEKLALNSKPWLWPTTNGPDKELDNYLVFELTGITDDGNTFGTVTNFAGADGLYANFIFEGSPRTDVNHFYRKVPIGEGNWLRNYNTGLLTFTFEDGTETSGNYIDAGTQDLGNGFSHTITNNALVFNLNGVDDWDNIFSDYDKIVKKPRRYWIEMTKQE
ncbi:hypothetical protein [Flavobacterium sp. RSP15]|uniref:hypothetical protein n=1 Tax=Flavobacterium sp. RSP15 TaxID=2497485 RepID=UPI0018F32B5F|nr:hypothetical protein [Flavobacterium sp. RSP15]